MPRVLASCRWSLAIEPALAPGESVLHRGYRSRRSHRLDWLACAVGAVVLLLLAAAGEPLDAVLFGIVALAAAMAYGTLAHRHTAVLVTPVRVLVVEGWPVRRVREIPLDRLAAVEAWAWPLLGFGRLTLTPMGGRPIVVDDLATPHALREAIGAAARIRDTYLTAARRRLPG